MRSRSTHWWRFRVAGLVCRAGLAHERRYCTPSISQLSQLSPLYNLQRGCPLVIFDLVETRHEERYVSYLKDLRYSRPGFRHVYRKLSTTLCCCQHICLKICDLPTEKSAHVNGHGLNDKTRSQRSFPTALQNLHLLIYKSWLKNLSGILIRNSLPQKHLIFDACKSLWWNSICIQILITKSSQIQSGQQSHWSAWEVLICFTDILGSISFGLYEPEYNGQAGLLILVGVVVLGILLSSS